MEHVISEDVWDQAQAAFSVSHNWIAYNSRSYFLEKEDAYFFGEEEKAKQFAKENKNKFSEFKVIYAQSLQEMLKQIPYGEKLNNKLNDKRSVATDDAICNTVGKQKQNSKNKNLSTMNEKNYDYLSKQLLYTGFGEELQAQLKEKMQKQEPQFTLAYQKDYGNDQTVATLHFKKSDESDMYFFNRYSLMLKNEQQCDALKQTFYMNDKADSITLKEAYNMMNGRAVHKELANKEGEKYKAWVQLDFKETDNQGNYKMKQYHQNYGYDLQAVLAKHPIKELMSEKDKERLVESLERGNRQSVTLQVNGKEQKVFIEAVPQFKALNFYEASGQRIRTDKLYESNSQEQSVKKDHARKQGQSVKQGEKKQSQKQAGGEEGEGPEPSQKKTKRKRQSIS